MPDYRKAARRAAQRHGIDPDLFERQIGAESNFNPRAGSPAGARGIAQIMPATARGWGVNLNDNRVSDDLDAAAKNMRRYVKQFGSYEKALRAYNAGPGAVERSRGYSETNNYVKKIMGGRGEPKRSPGRTGGGKGVRDAGSASTSQLRSTTTTREVDDPEAERRVALARYLQRQNPRSLLLRLGVVDQFEPTTRTETTTTNAPQVDGGHSHRGEGQPRRGGKSSGGLSPGGDFAGTTRPVIALAKEAHRYGLKTSSGKRGTVNTASGGVSDHYRGNRTANARDLSGSVQDMDRAAVALARKLGIKGYKKGRPLEKTVVRNGIRYQILYRTNTGGNHFDHIHVGAKKV